MSACRILRCAVSTSYGTRNQVNKTQTRECCMPVIIARLADRSRVQEITIAVEQVINRRRSRAPMVRVNLEYAYLPEDPILGLDPMLPNAHVPLTEPFETDLGFLSWLRWRTWLLPRLRPFNSQIPRQEQSSESTQRCLPSWRPRFPFPA